MAVAAVGAVTLDYAESGVRGGPTVLLIMGLGGQRIMWSQALLDALAGAGCHVVTFDNRDVGRSTILDTAPGDPRLVEEAFRGAPIAAPYRLSDMADDAVGLLDHLGVARAHVVGASMGGMIAQHLAFEHPARVASLTAISSAAGEWAPGRPVPDELTGSGVAPPTEREAFVDWFVEGTRALSAPDSFDIAAVRHLADLVHARGVHPGGVVRQLLAVLADGDRTERLRRVAVPTLVIHGADDPLIDVRAGRALAAAITGAELLVIDGMAHDMPAHAVRRIACAVATHVSAAP